MRARRVLALGVAFSCVAGAVGAQTVVVRNVPGGETIEVFVNAAKAATGVTDPVAGSVHLTIDPKVGVTKDMDSRVYVDVCSNLRRIHIVDRNMLPVAKEDGCDRREINGIFLVRPKTTLAVDAGSIIPTILLRQGRYDPTAGKIRLLAPKGLSVFGGGGLVQFDNPVRVSCGSVQDCDGDATVLGLVAGADFWVTTWLGVQGEYIKPRKITTQGAGGYYKFKDTYDAHLIALTGKAGLPIGRARLYGKGGAIFHSATTTSVNTIADEDQTLKLRTEGWSWIAGGGIEVWITKKFALYADTDFGRIRGDVVGDNLEGEAHDNLMALVGGFRVRIF